MRTFVAVVIILYMDSICKRFGIEIPHIEIGFGFLLGFGLVWCLIQDIKEVMR